MNIKLIMMKVLSADGITNLLITQGGVDYDVFMRFRMVMFLKRMWVGHV